eukprot:m.86679 g.86679  ORF g.86679 m.86679 type:complete len:178 (-) comp19855_c1_seq9:1469-2002(-)
MVMLVQPSQRVQGGHSTQSSSSLFVNIDSPPPHISAAGKRSGRSTSPAAASGKRRSRKEPLRAEYQTEDEYTSAYSQWREFRSKQAESVNRSRAKAKREDYEQDLKIRTTEHENQLLEQRIAELKANIELYRDVLSQSLDTVDGIGLSPDYIDTSLEAFVEDAFTASTRHRQHLVAM